MDGLAENRVLDARRGRTVTGNFYMNESSWKWRDGREEW
jgi:hypothetical protein